MILRVAFKDALMPKVINLFTPKTFLPGEEAEAKCEAVRLYREKFPDEPKRKFEVEMKNNV